MKQSLFPLVIVNQEQSKFLDWILGPLLGDFQKTLLQDVVQFVHVVMYRHAAGVPGFHLFCSLPQFVCSLLGDFTRRTDRFFLLFYGHCALVLVDLLLDVQLLVEELQVQHADLFLLAI